MSIPISKELRQWPHWKPAACDRQPLPQWSRGCQYLPLTVTKMFEILWKSYSILVNLKINIQDEDGGISVRPMSSEEVKVPKYIPWSPFHILKVRLSFCRPWREGCTWCTSCWWRRTTRRPPAPSVSSPSCLESRFASHPCQELVSESFV